MIRFRRKHPVEIVVAEKNLVLRNRLVKLLTRDNRFNLLVVATEGWRFTSVMQHLSFDIGLVEWEMPYLDGRGILLTMRNFLQLPPIIIYTDNANPSISQMAIKLGAAGFCLATDPVDLLLETIIDVCSGKRKSPLVDTSKLAWSIIASITSREQELLIALSRGQTNAQIATRLDISVNTVKFHLKNLYDKLGVNSRSQAATFYI